MEPVACPANTMGASSSAARSGGGAAAHVGQLLPMKIAEPSWARPHDGLSRGLPSSVGLLERLSTSSSLPSYVGQDQRCGGSDAVSCASEQLSASDAAEVRAPSKELSTDAYTTVMVLNIPNQISMRAFVEKLAESSYRGCYNFCNIPRALSTGKNLGFAFVNFETEEQARAFAEDWAGMEIFGKGKKLKTKPAKIQGIEANVQLAQKSMKRRSTSFKPLLSF